VRRRTIRYRQNIELMTPADVGVYSDAIAKAMTISDNRGYSHYARLHGWDAQLCKHHDPDHFFLPWHRAYLYMFERSLSDIAGTEIALPWWDWSNPQSDSGVPAAFDNSKLALRDAAVPIPPDLVKRVKHDAPYLLDFGHSPPRTVRDPDPVGGLPSPDDVKRALDAKSFDDFSEQVEDLHDGVHGWFKRTMSAIVFAAFDPIFWAHHTMIDRLWYLWQLSHPGSSIPKERLDRALEGFPLTFGQVLNINLLGYEYAATVIG